jgi:thiol-disulfide isomerase/thioredoxin
VGVDLPKGFGLQLMVPFVRAESTRAATIETPTGEDAFGMPLAESTDQGLGDIELRVRARLSQLLDWNGARTPRLTLTLGGAAPTGNFITKGSTDTSRYVSVGRGVWWALAGLDLTGAFAARFGYMAQFAARMPFGTLEGMDGYLFRWGPEVRVNAGPTVSIVPGVLSAALGGELLWRDQGEERVYSGSELEPFANGGGLFWTATAALQVQLPADFSLIVSGRLPVAFDLHGIQPVPSPTVFVGVNWNWSAAPAAPTATVTAWKVGEPARSPTIAALVVPGKITIVDYWATWCEPCKKLAPELEAFAEGREDVVLRKVDATEWGAAEMGEHLPAVAGLPVVDIYGRDGNLIARRVGPPCFDFAADVPAPMPTGASATEAP